MTPLESTLVISLAGMAVAAGVTGLLLLALLALPLGRDGLREGLRGRARHPVAWAWIAATVATAGSLFFSDGIGFAPCLFCWYQRIAMYPLVLVLGVGAWRADAGVWRYALPLAGVGVLLSAYHVSLQLRPAEPSAACEAFGPPCSARYLNVFGFVSIPVMAGMAFLFIIASLLVARLVDRPEP